MHVLQDRVNVFNVFLGGIGVIHAQVADAAEFAGDAEVEAHGFAWPMCLDDGLHEFDANINFLEGSMQQLKQDGIFVIEDIVYGYLPQWENYINKRNLNAAIVRLPHDTNHQDNCFVIILKPPKSDIDKVFDGGNQDQNR